MDFLSLSTAIHSCKNILSEKGVKDISLAPEGAVEPQVVQGGGQLLSERGVGQGRAAGQPPSCLLPDILVVAAEGLVDVEQKDKVFGLLQMGLLVGTLEQLRGQQL